MKTLLVERGIVVIAADGKPRVEAPVVRKSTAGPAVSPRAVTASEPEFYEQMAAKRPDLPARLKAFADDLSDIGIHAEFGRTLTLRWQPSPEVAMSGGYIEANGRYWGSSAWTSANRAGRASAGEAYLQEVAGIVGGQIRRYEKSGLEALDANGKAIDVSLLLDDAPRWKAALTSFVTQMASAE
jgi:hypothetical protein